MKLIMKKTAMKASIAVLFAALILAACSSSGNDYHPSNQDPDAKHKHEGKLLILQAYGTGDATDGSVSHSFIELYNNTDAPINLAGYSLQYADGTKAADEATEDGDWTVIELTGSIPSGGSYLVLGKKMNISGRLQIADNYGDKNDDEFVLSNRAFKIALIHSTEKLTVQNPFDSDGNGKTVDGYIDMVGATNDNTDQILGYEEFPASAKISKQKAIRRTFLTDTNDNSVDFASVDYRTSGTSAEELALKKPRNASEGEWSPIQEPEEQETPPTTAALMILQFGAATDGAISHSFVELYNNTETAINLGTYSLQYAAGTKVADEKTEDGDWGKIDLSGTIQPYHSFLILGDRGTNPEPALLLEDGSGDMNVSFALNNRAVKIALMSNQTLLAVQNPFDIDGAYTSSAGYVDMVGAENDATDKIFGYEFAPARLSKQQAPRRAKLTDTNNNQADFSPVDYRSADQTVPRPRNHANGAWDPRNGAAGKPEGPSVPRHDGPPEVVEPPVTSADYTKLKLNEVSGVGADSEKFYELINTGAENIPLEGCKIYYNANGATGGTLPTGKGNLTWTGSAAQVAQAGKLFILLGRNTEGSFTTGLTAGRILIITLEDPAGNVIDQCVRAADTGEYAITDKSYSRIPDGTGDFYFTTPTLNATNGTSTSGLTKVPVEPVVVPVTPPSEGSPKLMILQANTYGNDNGGAAGFAKSLVELYNNTDAAIDLTSGNYYLHIGTNNAWTAQIKLTGTIPAKCSYLIVSNSDTVNATPRAALPAADQEAAFAIANSNFKIALLKNQSAALSVANPFTEESLKTDYVDMLGCGTANGFETTVASAPSRPQGRRRTSLTDTDVNSADFGNADYRGYSGSNGMPDSELYKFWPRNAAAGAWNPITGLPQINPTVP
jgi:hypothetical protein